MANKMTPISQDVVVNLKARTSEIENSVKSLMQKLQGTNLSDSFTKGYSSSLQKVLDKSQELKKIISDTNSVNSKTTSNWSDSYNKLATELTKIIARIEGHPIDFNDLISFDSAQYKQLKKVFEDLSLAQKNVYNKANISKKLSDISSKTTIPKSEGKINSAVQISNEQEIYNLIRKETVEIQNGVDAQQKKLSILKEQVNASQQLKNLIGKDGKIDFTGLDTSTKQGQAAFTYAKQQVPSLSPNATRGQLTKAWTSDNTKALIKSKDISSKQTEIADMEKAIGAANTKMAQLLAYRNEVIAFIQQLATDFQALTQPIASADAALKKFEQAEINAAKIDLDKISTDADEIKTSIQGAQKTTEDWTDSLVQLETRQTFFSDLQSKITQIFGLANAFQALRRFVQESWTAIKELDAAFTEIAVVTEFTTGDLWKSFDTYNKMAQQLGVTTTDAIETSALYYQQGLDTADVMTLTTETIKMARIANMDFATATQAMTSAIRGFKLEMSDAQSITDTYSALAAEAAVDTDQLATAISKTASIAGSAGLTLEDTSAFLTQIIETTQEAPETAGTALKTIIARFTELKKNPATLTVEVEGEEVSANKIEEALRTADVALRDTEGNFRDLGDVFLELSSKWNGLDRNTQRYIATTAAGSRQQSRFIAMMDNYKRTMELVGIANDSAGAGAIQFAKTLDSVSARVNKLKSNFEALIGNLVENDTVKAILDTLNEGMTILVNASEKGIVAFGALIFMVGKAVKSALTLVINQFANVAKKNEELRAKIGKTIKTTVIYQPDLTLVNEANAKLQRAPITVGVSAAGGKIDDIAKTQTYTKLQQKKLDLQTEYIKSYDDVIKKQQVYKNLLITETSIPLSNISQFSSEVENAKKAVDTAIKDSRTATWKLLTPTIATTVGSGFIQGMMTGIISGDWKVGLATGIVSTVSSALSNPAITSAIGRMFTKSGGTIGTALAGIGGKVAAAVPYVLIAAGVAAIGYALWTWVDPVERTNKKLKEAKENLDKMNNALESSRANYLSDVSKVKSSSDNIDEYKKLSSQIGLTTDEQLALNDVVTKLAEQFPQIIIGYTEAGQVIIDQKTNWQEILELQKQSIALSQAQYAGDVVALVEAKEETRFAELNSAEARKEEIASDLKKQATIDLTNEGKLDPDSFAEGEFTNDNIIARIRERTEAKMAASLEYQAVLGELNRLEKQGALYVQERANAYKQIADSLVSNYQAFATEGDGKVDSQISELAQNELAKRVEGLGLDWDTDDEEVRQDNIAKAQAEADAYLIALQTQFDNAHIDMSKVAENMATMTEEDFISYLESKGITANGANAELYATLVLEFQTRNAGVQEILDIISGKTKEEKYTGTKVEETDIQDVINNDTIAAAYANMGKEAGANYINSLYQAVMDGSLSPEIANYLGTLNIKTQEAAKQAAAYLASTFDMDYETAVDIVFRYKNDEDGLINKQGLFDSTGIKSFFDNQQDTNSADQALKILDTGAIDLTREQTGALVEEFPELSGVLKAFSKDANKSTDGINKLKKALADASNNKKSIEYFKKIGEQVEILKDNLAFEDSYEYTSAMDTLKDSLNIFELENSSEIVLNNLSDIEAAANGNADAWIRVQQAIKNAALSQISFLDGVDASDQAIQNLIDQVAQEDFSATFSLNGFDNTSGAFESLYQSLMAVFNDADKVAAIIGAITGTTISAKVETQEIPIASLPASGGNFRMMEQGITTLKVPKITFTANKNAFSKYTPPSGGGGSKGGGSKGGGSKGGGGSDSPYEVKTDKYYNEINAIERLKTELEKLADLRDKGNLTPEEYKNNLNQTAKYYKDLQNNLHNYNENLRKDQAALAAEIVKLGVPNAISIKDGILSANKDAISALSSTTREKIDDMIDDWEKLSKTLEENSDGWWKVEYALEELADKYLESFISVEDKIRNVLIKQDQDKIDDAKKKYDKLKEADNDYLKALKDNISKRRNARNKETDYNDLAKKEKRLALLKRDTSGVYGAEILSLEEEIAQSRQELSDKEVDDMVDSLEEQATKRADAYDKELKELQDLQEDKEKSMIEYNKEVDKIMQSGAENVLKWLQTYDKEYITASETARQKYLEGWKATINEANGYVNNVANGTVMPSQDAASQKAQGIYSKIIAAGYGKGASDIQSQNAEGAYNWYNSFIKERKDLDESVKKLFWQIVVLKYQWDGSSSDYSEGGIARGAAAKNAQVAYSELSGISTEGLENASNPTYASAVTDLQSLNAVDALDWYNKFIKPRTGVNDRAKQLIQQIIKNKFMYETGDVPQNLGFSQGGLVDYTGPATVHGTPTKPEAFLSAADTKNFQILMELLNKAVNYRGDTQSDVPNALQIGECQIIVEVGSIADDYDVDQAIDKVKQSIVDNSNYRNVNIVTRKK